MDGHRFDELARALAAPMARRRFVGAILAALPFALRESRPTAARQGEDCPSFVGGICEDELRCGGGPNGFCTANACCDGVCADLLSDSANCGSCGSFCPGGAACVGGQCASPCPEPLVLCGEACVDLATDADNCGACGNPCGNGTVCVDGFCGCPDGLTSCPDGCVDIAADPANCGGCGAVCEPGGSCTEGACEPVCPEDTVACDDGCADLLSDPANCGGCGQGCPGGSRCTDGVCKADCPEGMVPCDDACVDLRSDDANCGACGEACPAESTCNDGVCEVVCPEGTVACDDACVDVLADPDNCGECGTACARGERCCDGRCTDIAADASHCGACGATCPDGTSCVDGSCPAEESSVETSVLRDVPTAGLCVDRAPSTDALLRLARAREATRSGDETVPEVLTREDADRLLEGGDRVDDATQDAVARVTRGALGCENKGDSLAQLGALTDDGISRTIAERGWTPDIIRLFEGVIQVPLPSDQQVAIVGTPTFRQLPDGRVAVRVGLDNPLLPRDADDLGFNDERIYVLRDVEVGWRIDRIVPVVFDPDSIRVPGEIRVQEAVCPPGMGAADFVAGACRPQHAIGFAFTSATLDPYTPASPIVTCCYPDGPGGYADCCADATWEGQTEQTLYPLPLGRTYWVVLSRGRGDEDETAWVVPGALGISFPSLFADPATLWGVSLTAGRPRALLTAYIFRDAACGTTCAGDEALCDHPGTGTSRWVELSSNPRHCGECGNQCGSDEECYRGRCRAKASA